MQINVNGQSYTRWEDVPADVRQQLAATLPDADKNGVPEPPPFRNRPAPCPLRPRRTRRGRCSPVR